MSDEGKKNPNYFLNLEEIIKFIFECENDRDVASEIQEDFEKIDGAMKLRNKMVKEVKTRLDNSNESTIRYDLIKIFLTSLFELPSQIEDSEDLTLGHTIVLNTMLNNNMLIEI